MAESSKQEDIMHDDPSKAFIGVRFVLFGFDPVKKEQVRSKLLDGGGVDVSRYCPDCTHVIVDKIVYDDPMCVSARRDGKTVVNSLWVDHSSEVGMLVDPASVMYRPLRDLNGIPGAKSLLICLTGYLRQDRDDIMTMVGLMGANFSKPLVANKVTHLICYKFEGEKYELARRMSRIKIVNHRWLEDCLKSWSLLPEIRYDQSKLFAALHSGYELEMMEAEAKVPAQSYGERKLVTTPQNSKSSHQYLLKQEIQNLTTSNIATSPQDTKSPLQSSLKQDLSGDLNLSASKVLSDQESNIKPLLSAGKGSKLSPISGFEQIQNRHPGMIDTREITTFGEKPSGLLLNDNVLASGTTTKQSPPEASKSCPRSYSRKSLRKFSPVTEVKSNRGSPPSVSAGKHNDGQSLTSLNIEQDGLNTASADAHKVVASSCGNVQSSILPEKRIMTTPSSSSKMQKITHTQGTGGDSALIVSGTEVLPAVPSGDGAHETSNHPSRDNGCCPDAKNALDPTNSSPVNICKIATPDSTIQQCSKEALETGLTETMGLRTCLGSNNTPCKAISPGSSKDGCADVEVQENELQGIKVKSPGSRMEIEIDEFIFEKIDELVDMELSKGGKSNPQSRMLGKRYLSKKTENSKQTSGKGRAKNQKGSIYLNKTAVNSTGEEEMKSNEKLNSEKVDVPAMDNADSSKETGKSRSLESEAEQTEPLFDETEAPDDKEEEFNVAVQRDNSNDIELQHSVDNFAEEEINVHKTDERITENNSGTGNHPAGHGALKTMVDQTDSVKNATEVKLKKDKTSPLSSSKKASPIAKKSTESRKGAERKRVINGKSKKGVGKQKRQASSTPAGVNLADTNKENSSMEVEKENMPAVSREQQNLNGERQGVENMAHKKPCKSNEIVSNAKATGGGLNASPEEEGVGKMILGSCKKPCKSNLQVEAVARCFIFSGHRLQRKEFQQVIKRLRGKSCRDSHQWSYQATHFVAPDPVRRTEKFFAAAASGRWILKVDYLAACNEAGKFLEEEPYEWHGKGLTEDLAISLEAPRKWRLQRQRTGHGAFYGMRIIVYGELIVPSLDTLKRVVKAGDGTILATSPSYTRVLKSNIDFAIVAPGVPRNDAWVQEFLEHKIPCVSADYLVEYVCKPGYSLDKHVQYSTHAWAEESLKKLVTRCEEVEDPTPSGDDNSSSDKISCKACGSDDAREAMVKCGCGVGIHIGCCNPQLEDVPKEAWHCPECKPNESGSKKPKRKRCKV
nr:BRCT domain-containing protein [Ipomoea batatas]